MRSTFSNEAWGLTGPPPLKGGKMFAFLFSKLGAYLVGGLLIVALSGGGYLYVKHLRKVAGDAQAKAAAAELKVQITQEALDAAAKTKTAQVKVRQKNVQNKQEIDQTVETDNLPGVADLYGKYGVRIPQSDTPPSGASGNPRH